MHVIKKLLIEWQVVIEIQVSSDLAAEIKHAYECEMKILIINAVNSWKNILWKQTKRHRYWTLTLMLPGSFTVTSISGCFVFSGELSQL